MTEPRAAKHRQLPVLSSPNYNRAGMTAFTSAPARTDQPGAPQPAEPPLELSTRIAACPVCGCVETTAVMPTVKFDPATARTALHPVIRICVCPRCGLVHENPLLVPEESEDYADRHYYNAQNQLLDHDLLQRRLAAHRWLWLRDRLPWTTVRDVLDVGACGAWSAFVKRRLPEARSVLVEPSRAAVLHAQQAHPEIEAVRAGFEAYAPGSEQRFDVITFFYSFYMFPSPRTVLRKAKRLLRPGGHLVIDISHVLMETEIWSRNGAKGTAPSPWLNLFQLVRGVPVVYYSPRTLRALLEDEGFAVIKESVFGYPAFDPITGRQERIFIARPNEAPPMKASLPFNPDVAEARWAFDFVSRYAEAASERAIAAFLDRTGRSTGRSNVTLVVDDDPTYRGWLERVFAAHDVRISWLPPARAATAPDRAGEVLLLGGRHGLDVNALKSRFLHTQVIDATLPGAGQDENWIAGADGRPIIARAFCPIIDKDADEDVHAHTDLFPFARASESNDLSLDFSAFARALALSPEEAAAFPDASST
jgi:SAM-dependent methyltransferase